MRRTVVFASYSKQGIIADYILYYLRGLQEVADRIIFIADNEVCASEQEKLEGIVVYKDCKRHGCYDFGSYRKGYEWAEENGVLNDTDELIFCNDSCYGPITPFGEVFSKMEEKNCDFWGMVESHVSKIHLQSYYLVFKKQVFHSNAFRNFVLSLEKQDSFDDYVAKYETSFTDYLCKAGFSYSAFMSFSDYQSLNGGKPFDITLHPITTINFGMPLIKRKVFTYAFESFLEDSISALMELIKKENEVLFRHIKNDMPNIYCEMRPMPGNNAYEMASLVGESMNQDAALRVFYQIMQETGDREMYKAQQHIKKLDEHIDFLGNRIKELEQDVQKDQVLIQQQQGQILMQLKQFQQQQEHIDEMQPVYDNKYSLLTYKLVNRNKLFYNLISLHLKFLKLFAKIQ